MPTNTRKSRVVRSTGAVLSAGLIVASFATLSGAAVKPKATVYPAYPSGKITTNDIKLAAAYTGGTANKQAKGTPVKVGWLNDDGDTVAYPDNTTGANLAVSFVNKYLGGIKGHPLQLVSCSVNNAGDGASCAQQMVSAGVKVVVTGTIIDGNAAMYNTLAAAHIPIIQGSDLTTTDFNPPGKGVAVTYEPGSPGVVLGLAKFIGTSKSGVGLGFAPKSIAVVYTNDAGGTSAYNLLFKPDTYLKGLTIHGVAVSPTADAAQVQSAVVASGAGQDSVFVPLTPVSQCIAVYDALKTLNIKAPVVTSGLCFGTQMIQHLNGTLPKNWYFGDYGVNYFMYDSKLLASEQLGVYMAAIHQADPSTDPTGLAAPAFGTILTLNKLYNEAGISATSAKMGTLIEGFKGPQFGNSGPLKCGFQPLLPAICGQEMGVALFNGTNWVAVEDAYNNKLISGFSGFGL
jgi:branched-chain amino acid transport system substrate-binding protein